MRGEPEILDVTVKTRDAELPGILTVPAGASGAVLFAHGSGSSRHSPRNRMVAARLVDEGFATLVFDLLTPEEAESRDAVFDVPALAERLEDATGWLRTSGHLDLPIGYLGASTGAGAALWAAADLGEQVRAVVSRGGRPDLAAPVLEGVVSPTLLLVGERDPVVLELNREAQGRLRCPCELRVIPGATHLFEEPGALEEVAELSAAWFRRHLASSSV